VNYGTFVPKNFRPRKFPAVKQSVFLLDQNFSIMWQGSKVLWNETRDESSTLWNFRPRPLGRKFLIPENRNLVLFLIEINNMRRTRHILPIPRTCIWRRCGRYGVSWHQGDSDHTDHTIPKGSRSSCTYVESYFTKSYPGQVELCLSTLNKPISDLIWSYQLIPVNSCPVVPNYAYGWKVYSVMHMQCTLSTLNSCVKV